MLSQIISTVRHRFLNTNNALIAHAVRVCSEDNVPYLVYARWNEGSLADFKRHNGFEPVRVPVYYVPLNLKGRIALLLGLHQGLKALIPKWVKSVLKGARKSVRLALGKLTRR